MKQFNRDGNRGGGGSFRGSGDRRGGYRNDSGPKEMHKAVCSECGEECEVPFKPTQGRDVLCKECYKKKKGF